MVRKEREHEIFQNVRVQRWAKRRDACGRAKEYREGAPHDYGTKCHEVASMATRDGRLAHSHTEASMKPL
jgi:hypothetical protein